MSRTLRLLMPQWQGGNNPPYYFGAKLLAWLAPENDDDLQVEVPVEPYDRTPLQRENGIVGRSVLMKQLRSAAKLIEAYEPDRIVTFGGDCLISQAPFAYLNQKYERMGILWLDAHPDISTPEMFYHAHAMVMGNLIGEGDPGFSSEVAKHIKPQMVMYGGLQEMTDDEDKVVKKLQLRKAGPRELVETSEPILKWIKEQDIQHLAIHFDLDVLDPKLFRSLLFAEPAGLPIDSSCGEMTLQQIARIIQDVSGKTDVVGLSIAEHIPWDAINLKNFMETISILKSETRT